MILSKKDVSKGIVKRGKLINRRGKVFKESEIRFNGIKVRKTSKITNYYQIIAYGKYLCKHDILAHDFTTYSSLFKKFVYKNIKLHLIEAYNNLPSFPCSPKAIWFTSFTIMYMSNDDKFKKNEDITSYYQRKVKKEIKHKESTKPNIHEIWNKIKKGYKPNEIKKYNKEKNYTSIRSSHLNILYKIYNKNELTEKQIKIYEKEIMNNKRYKNILKEI